MQISDRRLLNAKPFLHALLKASSILPSLLLYSVLLSHCTSLSFFSLSPCTFVSIFVSRVPFHRHGTAADFLLCFFPTGLFIPSYRETLQEFVLLSQVSTFFPLVTLFSVADLPYFLPLSFCLLVRSPWFLRGRRSAFVRVFVAVGLLTPCGFSFHFSCLPFFVSRSPHRLA